MHAAPVQREERIVIVGGGPVGFALSLILAKYQVPTIVLESREKPTPKEESRAIVWMPRGLELVEWLGLKEEFHAAAVLRTSHEFRIPGRKLMTLSFREADSPYAYSAQMPQHDTETLLEEAARKTGLVDIRRGHQVMEIGHLEEGISVVVQGPDSVYVLHAPWAVGADGARSMVRKSLGISAKWRDYGTDSAVADFEMETDLPKDVSSIVLDPARPYGFFYFGEGTWRFIYRLNPGEDRKEMTTEAAATALLRSVYPKADIRRFLWASAFRLGQGQSETYRKGRWLLAGDAAHAMGPSAGAGMMIGLLGAWRLGWRLAQAFRGNPHSDRLLQDYEREQRAGSDEIQDTNATIFANMAMSNPILAALRSFGLRTASFVPSVAKSITAKEALLSQALPVEQAEDGGHPAPWKPVKSAGPWQLGKRLPYMGHDGGLILPGRLNHALVSIGAVDKVKERETAAQFIGQAPVPVTDDTALLGPASPYRIPGAKGVVLALVRPDQHVAGIYQL